MQRVQRFLLGKPTSAPDTYPDRTAGGRSRVVSEEGAGWEAQPEAGGRAGISPEWWRAGERGGRGG